MRKFTNAPLPSLGLIFKGLIKKNPGTAVQFNEISKANNHLNFNFSRSAWSLEFIAKLRTGIMQTNTIKMMVPDYFCNSSLAALRKIKVDLVFYPVNQNGEGNIDEIDKILKKNKIDLFLAVHFFGNYYDFSAISKIIKASNAWFIEDCSHMLTNPDPRIHFADFQIFSPHKLLPLPDGAILIANKGIFEKGSNMEIAKTIYSEYSEYDFFEPFKWLLKRLLQKLGVGVRLGINNFFHDDEINSTKRFPKPAMTPFSKSLLSHLMDTLEEEESTRKENSDSWVKIMSELFPSARVIYPEGNFHSYYLLGFEFEEEKDLIKAIFLLNKKKFPICTWPDLPPEVLDNRDYFREAIDLRYKTIFFHVHSSIRKKDIESSL